MSSRAAFRIDTSPINALSSLKFFLLSILIYSAVYSAFPRSASPSPFFRLSAAFLLYPSFLPQRAERIRCESASLPV
ncbi:hypothetical protein HMPREF1986_00365 [Oribacterium sp. oral taxon 078 str. F0263]|nr:hypothetical protein HMPREF1986_00365 [Oribacterium sp. oral taxon 078 str. F0263]